MVNLNTDFEKYLHITNFNTVTVQIVPNSFMTRGNDNKEGTSSPLRDK